MNSFFNLDTCDGIVVWGCSGNHWMKQTQKRVERRKKSQATQPPRSGRKKINVPFLFLLYTLVCNLLGGKKTCTIGLLCIHAWLKNQAGTGKRETETETEKEEAQIILLVATLAEASLQKNVKPSYLGLTCKIRDFIAKTQQ